MSTNANTGWISFADQMPEPAYDRKNPDQPTHGMILVTNSIEGRDRWGNMSHVWLTGSVYLYQNRVSFNGMIEGEEGEITAYAEPSSMRLRNLTHWRPAVPEEKGWAK